MAIIYSYPEATGITSTDCFIITDSSNPNKTRNLTATKLLGWIDDNLSYDLSQVLLAGNTATNNIILTGNFTGTGDITRTGDLTLTGALNAVGVSQHGLRSQGGVIIEATDTGDVTLQTGNNIIARHATNGTFFSHIGPINTTSLNTVANGTLNIGNTTTNMTVSGDGGSEGIKFTTPISLASPLGLYDVNAALPSANGQGLVKKTAGLEWDTVFTPATSGTVTSRTLPIFNGTTTLSDSQLSQNAAGTELTINSADVKIASKLSHASGPATNINFSTGKIVLKTSDESKINVKSNGVEVLHEDSFAGGNTTKVVLQTDEVGIQVKGGTNGSGQSRGGQVKFYNESFSNYAAWCGPIGTTGSYELALPLPYNSTIDGGKIMALPSSPLPLGSPAQMEWVSMPVSTYTNAGAGRVLLSSGTGSIAGETYLTYSNRTLQSEAGGNNPALRIRANNLTSTQGWNDDIGAANFYNSDTSTNSTQIAINVPNKTGINRAIDFYYNQNSGTGSIGGISVSSSAVAYNTGSDYRLKENVVDMTDAVDRVKQLKPKRFNFIVDPSNTVDGLIAHEAAEVVPEAVSGKKDGDIYQGIDQSKLVPLLIGAIKELTARIEALEA